MTPRVAALFASLCLVTMTRLAASQTPLLNNARQPTEALLETLLSPGDFPGRVFIYVSQGDEATFCMDASLDAIRPFAQVYPERIDWPVVGDVPIVVKRRFLKLEKTANTVTNEDLDNGFSILWQLTVKGQVWQPEPAFVLEAVGAEVMGSDGRPLFKWAPAQPPPVCTNTNDPSRPRCDLQGISAQTSHISISPDGRQAALAFCGLKPRMEVFSLKSPPERRWQALFGPQNGCVISTGFSADGRYVVALLANGAIHRYDAATGGHHQTISTKGTAVTMIPMADLAAVAGEHGEMAVVRLGDGTIEWRIPARDNRGRVDQVAASGNGRRLATLEYGAKGVVIRVYELHNRKAQWQFELTDRGFNRLALGYQGKTIYLTHDTKGLATLPVVAHGSPRFEETTTTDHNPPCRGTIYIGDHQNQLYCPEGNQILRLKAGTPPEPTYFLGMEANSLLLDMTPAGGLIATGGGHLLWWPPPIE